MLASPYYYSQQNFFPSSNNTRPAYDSYAENDLQRNWNNQRVPQHPNIPFGYPQFPLEIHQTLEFQREHLQYMATRSSRGFSNPPSIDTDDIVPVSVRISAPVPIPHSTASLSFFSEGSLTPNFTPRSPDTGYTFAYESPSSSSSISYCIALTLTLSNSIFSGTFNSFATSTRIVGRRFY